MLKANSHIPCRAHAMLCREGFRSCLSRLIYTVRPRLIHTCCAVRAIPQQCNSESDLSRLWHSTAWARHGMHELASAILRQCVWATYLRSASSGYHAWFHDGYQKHINPLNCRTSSSDISGYHAGFHEGLSENGRVVAWHV
jgi:hypothetical protein